MKKLTGIYLKLGDTAKGAAYAQRAAEETGDPFLTEQAMYGYFMLAQGEECLELAEAALKEDPDSFIALSYAGRAAMLLDDYPAVADYGVRLSDIAKESDDPYADYMLYQFVKVASCKVGTTDAALKQNISGEHTMVCRTIIHQTAR